ncbi:MAG: hypothetical protein CBD18_02100 [Opitutales bacterium TMED158]|nr:MAG: hypothetical protein CBD18_02100 [Opitutales bacterium TMED158]
MNIDPQTPTPRGPGRPRQSESEKADVRERLLDAATELAVEQGFEACGLREIATRAEVSPAMISYYFGDRDGLYEAMFGRAFERVSEKVAAVMADPLRSGSDRIDDLVAIQVKAIAADPWLPKLVMREVLARNGSPMQEFVSDAVAKGPLQMMVDWIEQEQERHEIRSDYDPRMLAMTIASLTGFPFLMLPLVGDRLGLELDDEFPDRLIAHNQKLLSNALRAHTEEK